MPEDYQARAWAWGAKRHGRQVCEQGKPEFKRAVQRKAEVVKACLQYRGTPDPLKGEHTCEDFNYLQLVSAQHDLKAPSFCWHMGLDTLLATTLLVWD